MQVLAEQLQNIQARTAALHSELAQAARDEGRVTDIMGSLQL